MLLFTRWDVQQAFIDKMIEVSMKPKSVIIWDKMVHGMGDLKKGFASRYESIIWWCNDNFRFPGKRPTDIVVFKRVSANKLIHPNEKPVELLADLIKKTTVEGDTVLDCCMGSGSTGVAAVMNNRNFIGIELDEGYFNIAKDRIKECYGTV